MTLITRSATIQVRVVPRIKTMSEYVLAQIGLTMSEAIELFLRRMIIEQRIPFEIVALDVAEGGRGLPILEMPGTDAGVYASVIDDVADKEKAERPNKKFKKIFGGASGPKKSKAAKRSKRASN